MFPFLFHSVTSRQERMHQRMNSVEALVSTVEGHVLELGFEFHKAKEAFLKAKDVVRARTGPPSPWRSLCSLALVPPRRPLEEASPMQLRSAKKQRI